VGVVQDFDGIAVNYPDYFSVKSAARLRTGQSRKM